MSDTKNGSHESIDTSPLRPDQLSDHELSIILSIEDRLKIQQASAPTAGKNQKPYLASDPGATPTGAPTGWPTWHG